MKEETKMTAMQQSQYEQMIAQSIINNIHICGRGTIKKTGQQFIIVSSSNGVDCYAVMIDGMRLTCNCRAGQCGRYCSHRAIVREHLMATAAQSPKVQPAPARLQETFRNAPVMSIYR